MFGTGVETKITFFLFSLQAGHFTVSLKAPGRNKHFRVKNTDGTLEIGQQKFTNLEDLIEHYKKHPIFKQETEKLYLVKPFTCPSNDNWFGQGMYIQCVCIVHFMTNMRLFGRFGTSTGRRLKSWQLILIV